MSTFTDSEIDIDSISDRMAVLMGMRMTHHKFKVGQRVTCSNHPGIPATIKIISRDDIGVEYDEEIIGGHDLGGNAKKHQGYWEFSTYLTPLLDEKTDPRNLKYTNRGHYTRRGVII